MVEQYSPEDKKSVLSAFVRIFQASMEAQGAAKGKSPATMNEALGAPQPSPHELILSQGELERLLQTLIIPLLTYSLERGQLGCLDGPLIDAVVTKLLDPGEERSAGWQSESLRIEMLHLGTVLIKYASELMQDHRKELIKFGWNYLKARAGEGGSGKFFRARAGRGGGSREGGRGGKLCSLPETGYK